MFRALAFAVLLLPAGLGAAELPCRPAERYAPPDGASYRAEQVEVTAPDGARLVGTLTVPEKPSGPLPAALLITGSGPQSRDMAIHAEPPLSLYRPFRQIADHLSGRGFAVLRLDDRGAGCSEGKAGAATTAELADDGRAAVAFLRRRPEIDGQSIALIGTDEGASIAIQIAAGDPGVAAVVSLAGPGANGLAITEFQHRHMIATGLLSPEETYALTRGTRQEQILAQRMADVRARGLDGRLGRWTQYYLGYNPVPAARQVRCPALILHGDRDTQIPVDHAQILAAAMRAGGNDKVAVRILPGVNHLFLDDPDGTFALYGKLMQSTNQLSDKVLATIGDWLAATLKAN